MNHRLLKGFVVFALLAAITAIVFLGDTSVRQHFRLRKASAHKPAVQAVLASDAAYANVIVASWTGGGGMLMVAGEVPTREDADRLKEAVAATNPPVGVRYTLRVDGKPIRE